MTESMSPERFRALADTYGGAVARWPDAARIDARRLAEQPWARAVLSEADALDAALGAWTLGSPDPVLAARIAGTAQARHWRPFKAARLWWSGIAVGAALAGAATGSVAATLVEPVPSPLSTETGTIFGDMAPESLP